jgi:hypothetical protein
MVSSFQLTRSTKLRLAHQKNTHDWYRSLHIFAPIFLPERRRVSREIRTAITTLLVDKLKHLRCATRTSRRLARPPYS